jgi:hypothetical protein
MNVIRINESVDLSETGVWARDNELGRQLALDTIEHMIRYESPGHLLKVVRGMVAGGRFGGIEVGFFTVLAIMIIE